MRPLRDPPLEATIEQSGAESRAPESRERPRPRTLGLLCDLFALSTIEGDRAWWMEHGRMSSSRGKQISREVNDLCRKVRPLAVDLVNAFGIPDVPERVHWENDLATVVGTPAAYDYGPERCSWLTHHITNWMGDDGFLRNHQSQIRHHNVVGDWLKITGKVTGKAIDDDGHAVVTISQEAHNQHGDLSAVGTGTVRLPRRP